MPNDVTAEIIELIQIILEKTAQPFLERKLHNIIYLTQILFQKVIEVKPGEYKDIVCFL